MGVGLVFCGGKEDKNDLASTNMSREEARPDKALWFVFLLQVVMDHLDLAPRRKEEGNISLR